MFNQKNSHYSGMGIASARRNQYGRIWFGTNALETLQKSNMVIIAEQQVQLAARSAKINGQKVRVPADKTLAQKLRSAMQVEPNWRKALISIL